MEAWYALYLAIVSTVYLTPDDAHSSLLNGRIIKHGKKNWEPIA